MKIYGLTVVCSEGYLNGRESYTELFASKEDCLERAWSNYHTEVKQNSEYLEDVIDDELQFIAEIAADGYVVGQWPDYHMQWEMFEQEI